MQRPLKLPTRRIKPVVSPPVSEIEEPVRKVAKPLVPNRGSRLPQPQEKSLNLQSSRDALRRNVDKIALVKVDNRNLQIEVFREIEDPKTGQTRKGWVTHRGSYYRWSKHLIEELAHIVTPEEKTTLDEIASILKALKREVELAVKGQSDFLVFVSKRNEADEEA